MPVYLRLLSRSLLVCVLLLATGVARAQEPGEILWRTQLEMESLSMNRPELGPDGAIYMFLNDIFVIEPDGSIRLQIDVNSIYTSDVAVAPDGRIFVVASFGPDHYVVSYSPTGDELWSSEVEGSEPIAYGPSLGPDGNLYGVIGAFDSGEGAFSMTAEGVLRWNVDGYEQETNSGPHEVPFGIDRFYAADESVPCQPFSNGIAAFSFDGTMLWCYPGIVEYPPVVGPDGSVYGVGYNSLTKFSPDGDLLWQFNFPSPVGALRNPSIGPDGTVYVQESRSLWAFNPDGSVRYEVQIVDMFFPVQPTVSPDGSLVVTASFVDDAQYLIALDASDGAEQWRTELPGYTDPPFTFSEDGRVIYIPLGFVTQDPVELIAVYAGTSPANPTDGEDEAAFPEEAALSAPHPNPFTRRAALTLTVDEAQAVTVAVYDALGRRVAVLHDGPLAAGPHPFTFEGAGLPSGVYVVRAAGETFGITRRVTLVR